MPSLKSLLNTQETENTSGEELSRKIAGAGLLRLNPDLNDSDLGSSLSMMSRITTSAADPTAQQMEKYRKDMQDFHEFKWQLNADEEMPVDESESVTGNSVSASGSASLYTLHSNYFDVQRLFI